MIDSVFITGATGVVGSSVLPHLINNTDARIKILLRTKGQTDTNTRLIKLCQFIQGEITGPRAQGQWRTRLEAVTGDLEVPRLGLSASAFQELGESVSHIVHCGANVDLTQPVQDAVASSHLATRQILDLQRLNPKAKLDYVSTVGVNGRLKTPLSERPVTSPRVFFNSYELAKAKSEELVYSAMESGQRITVHRPSMVVGHAKTGRIIHFQVFYFLVRLITGQLTKGLLPPLLFRKLDTIPCDFVGRLIFEAMRRPELDGQFIHLCSGPEAAVSLGEIRTLAEVQYKKIGIALPKLRVLPKSVFQVFALGRYFSPMNSKLRTRLELLPQFLAYASQSQDFENHLSKSHFSGLTWPSPMEYLDSVLEYYVQSHR